MTALWIASADVSDPETYAKYAGPATEAIEAHGGVFLARGGDRVQLEGSGRARNVVIRFPSLEVAEACYNSPKYQEALEYAKAAAIRDIFVVEEIGE